jgi:four helix bundle protein
MIHLEKLDVWQRSYELSLAAYRLTLNPPLSRHFGLADQIRRSSTSIPANLAEGYALGTTPQFLRHLRIALGSAAELRIHLRLLVDLQLVPAAEAGPCRDLCERTLSLLYALIRSLNRRHVSRLTSPVSRLRQRVE